MYWKPKWMPFEAPTSLSQRASLQQDRDKSQELWEKVCYVVFAVYTAYPHCEWGTKGP